MGLVAPQFQLGWRQSPSEDLLPRAATRATLCRVVHAVTRSRTLKGFCQLSRFVSA